MKTLNQFFIGPELFLLLSGIFFLFPTNSRRAYFLVIPMGQTLAKLFILIMDRQFHKLDGIKARIDGLRSLMKSEYSALMESEQKKLKDFQTKY